MKYFSWHVSTLIKDLRLVGSIQTNHTYTSLNSIEVIFFLYFFPGWAHDSSFAGASVVGRLYSYSTRVLLACLTRSDVICVIKPDRWVRSEVLSPTPHWDMRWQSHHIITKSALRCRTAFLHRCLVLDRPNTSDLMVISMDLFSLDRARLLSF